MAQGAHLPERHPVRGRLHGAHGPAGAPPDAGLAWARACFKLRRTCADASDSRCPSRVIRLSEEGSCRSRHAEARRRLRTPTAGHRPELSIVVATLNERDNVATLVRQLEQALASTHWEVIFVDDDSPDGTGGVVRAIARANPRVRCLRRIGRRGLAGALHRGNACLLRAGRRGHGRRPPARRDAAAAHARAIRRWARISLFATRSCVRRDGPDRPVAGARVGQPARQRNRRAADRHAAERPHERLLHDPARGLRRPRAQALDTRLQAAARHRRVAETAPRDRRASLPLPRPPARRLQAERGGRGDGLCRSAASQAFGRSPARPVRAVCAGGSDRPPRASGGPQEWH